VVSGIVIGHRCEAYEGATHRLEVAVTNVGDELGFEEVGGLADNQGSCFSSLGREHDEAPAILRVDLAIEVAPQDQKINEVTGGLLGQSEVFNDRGKGHARCHGGAYHVGAVSREVVVASFVERRPDRPAENGSS
jgi:hypothetical protein